MILIVVLAAAATWFLGDLMLLSPEDADRRAIAYQRSERLLRASTGAAMPGQPDLANLPKRLAAQGLAQGAPVLMRIFKREFELELWMQREGVFHRFATYPICLWSGRLGPKLQTGDGQAPEGFYSVGRTALNPNSKYYRSFNLGFPNLYDRGQGRTGSFLMVHGGCASVGCFAMTNAQMDEIWRLINAAFDGGQGAFQVQIFPFRMTEEKLKTYAGHGNESYWRDLKIGHDLFEATLQPPAVSVCQGRYQFGASRAGKGEAGGIADRCLSASATNIIIP